MEEHEDRHDLQPPALTAAARVQLARSDGFTVGAPSVCRVTSLDLEASC